MTRLTAVRRNLAAAAAVPLLLTGLAACGEDGGDQATDPAGDSAAGAALLAGLQTGDEVDPGEFVDLVVDGLEASTTAHLTMTTSMGKTGEMTAEGDVDYTAEPVAMAMTMSMPMMGGSPADIRFVDGIFYMSLGQMTDGKFWKLDPSDSSSPLGDLGSMLDGLDPRATMERVEPAIDTVTYDGEEDVDGRTLDRYELTVDTAALAEAMDAPAAAMAQLPDTVSYDLWLDEEHRMAQTTMELPIQGSTAVVEMSMDDWGKDVSIEAPAADQITELPDMLGSASAKPEV
ncbi:MAG TPA: LppX_LprAFG lipoprotein [Nocardioides sp.]|nr:LppX_LprAFG lipoprotein [Nocardioides sp.]